MADKKTWEMNETQKAFLNTLESYPDGTTLKDIELDTGVVFKTGCINTLISKGLVKAADGEFKVQLVYRGAVIGTPTKKWKVYRLVNRQ